MPYDEDCGFWTPPYFGYEDKYVSKYTQPKAPLIEVLDVLTHKKFNTDTTEMELRFIYSGKTYAHRLQFTNEFIYQMYMGGDDSQKVSLWLFEQLANEAAYAISDNEYIRKMACNIFMSFYANLINEPLDSKADKFSIGNHDFYKNEAVHKGTLDYIKLMGKESKDPSVMSRRLPGMDHMERCPARDSDPKRCLTQYLYGSKATLWNMIQHLNDHHKWTREGEIADWLDKLHDDGKVDLSFKTPDN